jgi:L-threonylcarbamoyladenylate synthase
MSGTILLQINAEHPQEDLLEQAAIIIRGGDLVAFPTETVYGLGADALNEAAVRKIFQAKGRPADNPLIVHISSREMLSRVASEVSDKAERLIEKFWAGPLTLVLKRKDDVAAAVSCGLPTVAVRMPANKIALALIEKANTPIAAPSANRSGRPSPTTAAHVLEDLNGRIELILDGGGTSIGIESTVVDMTGDIPMILRPSWVTLEMLEAVTGEVRLVASEDELKRSPGTRYRHYSPHARVVLLENTSADRLKQICEDRLKTGPIGLIHHTPVAIDKANLSSIQLLNNPEDYARRIYSALRELDETNPETIIIEGISETGEGAAVMDRLRRAASEIHQ